MLHKTWIALAFVLLSSGAGAEEDSRSLAETMRAMAAEFESARSYSANEETYSRAADHSRRLRAHVISAVSKTPRSLELRERDEKLRGLLEYHQLMSRLIYMSASLEDAFTSGEDYSSISVSREMDIESLFHEIAKLMKAAHERFR